MSDDKETRIKMKSDPQKIMWLIAKVVIQEEQIKKLKKELKEHKANPHCHKEI